MPRKVRLARSRPVRTASSKPLLDAAVILLTRATLMTSSLIVALPRKSARLLVRWGGRHPGPRCRAQQPMNFAGGECLRRGAPKFRVSFLRSLATKRFGETA
jgi:hypothetical protein